MMRRMVQASLCVTLVWFGVMQLGGGGLNLQNKTVQAAENAGDFRSITYQYEAKSMLAKPGGRSSGAAPKPDHKATEDKRQADETDKWNEAGGAASEKTRDDINAGKGATAGAGADGGGAGNGATAGAGAIGGGVGNGATAGAEATGGGASDAVTAGNAATEGAGAVNATTVDGSGAGGAATTNGAKSGEAPQGGKADASQAADGQAAKSTDKIVYLTFDDGPSQHTPEVLSILKREGVVATFFLLGEQVERRPELVKQIVAEGHAVGNHTYNHVYKELYGGFRNFADQIMRTDDLIHEAAGIRTTLVRAPGGTFTNFDRGYFEGLKAAGYQVHDWNVDSGDSKRVGVPASEIIANIRGSKIANALNVLMHDSSGHAETVKALPDIIAYYKKLGYTFAALDEKAEPMQFRLASKTKWSRAAVTEADKTRLVQFASKLDRNGILAKQSQPQRGAEQGAGLGPEPRPEQEPVLVIHRGAQKLELLPSDYKLVNGSIRVPLGKLSEWLGGTADLDKEQGVARVTMDGRQWFWLADSLSTGSDDPNRLDVPIRATLAQFGMDIESYVYTKEQREVWIGA